MNKSNNQNAALDYARSSQPLDPEMGWRREDVQVAFLTGMQALAVPRLLSLPEVTRTLNVSASMIHDLVRHGELAFVHAGRGTVRKHLTFTASEIESYIKRNTERVNYSPRMKTARRSSSRDDESDFSAWVAARKAELKAAKKK